MNEIHKLNSSLRTSLIDRSRRDIALTPAGQQFLAVVRPVLQQLSVVAEALRHADARRLRINVLPSFAARWLLPRIGDFFLRHPDIDVDISSTQALVDLGASGARLGIRYGSGQWPGVRSELLFDECLFPVASPGYIREHGIHANEDLPRATLLRDDFHPWTAWFEQHEVAETNCTFGAVYRDSALAVQAAENGQGVALARSWLVADALAAKALCRIGSTSIPAGAAYFLVLPRDAVITEEVREFTAWLRSQAAGSGYTARPSNEESR
ncbi:LysR substrate-binding domain-containing protein [Massilia arenae]|uniref:LysR substrate-binding domain-containing protein n=1 Tax=Massilia arenae TaxID=2603288 RepID=A0A5C7FKX7_9BURK|nr:LysR substrate-binding domain-containing protein [Massilia arenae]TXF95806.1 hypothetical protein FVD38_26235 [Massilia arenae]